MISIVQSTLESEARIRQYLRMAVGIEAHPSTLPEHKEVMQGVRVTLLWVLKEVTEDPPGLAMFAEESTNE